MNSNRSAILGVICFLAAAPVHAAADVRVVIPAPAPQPVYEPTAYAIAVANIGNQSAAAVSLTVTLPATHTSPTRFVMGTLADVDPRCTKSGTRLVCALGTLAKNKTTIVSFTIALPQAAEVLGIGAVAATTSTETSTANNTASDTPVLLHEAVAVHDGATATNRHCTGTGLTSFFECEVSPSSISAHDVVFHGDGTLTFVGVSPDVYSGVWWQDAGDSLAFHYIAGGEVVAEFAGRGTNPDCFEGVTTFPGSAYVAPYEVCLH